MESKTEVNKRIEQLVFAIADGNKSAFAAQIGISEANIRNYINGVEPKAIVLEKIVTCFGVSAEWLLTGNGSMLRTSESSALLEPQNPHELDVCRTLLKEKDVLILEQAKEIGRLEERLSNFQTRSRAQSPHGTAIPVPDPSEISRDMPKVRDTTLPSRAHSELTEKQTHRK